MADRSNRWVQSRRNGTDPVGSFGARRISQELRDWIANEATITRRTQRAVFEDALESFLKYRNRHDGRYQYENLPLNQGGTFRVFIRIDLLHEVLDLIEKDGIFHGDLVNAAIKYEMEKDGNSHYA